MSDLSNSRISNLASLGDADFEDQYFGYDPRKDPEEEWGMNLNDEMYQRAQREGGKSLLEWIEKHEKIYLKRQDRKITALEQLKTEAIRNWDGLNYVRACNSLGLDPEFNDLYEQGLAEEAYSRRLTSKINPHLSKYTLFYQQGIVLN